MLLKAASRAGRAQGGRRAATRHIEWIGEERAPDNAVIGSRSSGIQAHLHLQRVRGLLEANALARGAGTHAVGSGVDHFRASEFGQNIEHRTG